MRLLPLDLSSHVVALLQPSRPQWVPTPDEAARIQADIPEAFVQGHKGGLSAEQWSERLRLASWTHDSRKVPTPPTLGTLCASRMTSELNTEVADPSPGCCQCRSVVDHVVCWLTTSPECLHSPMT